jgi:cardiolipin synthase A/B
MIVIILTSLISIFVTLITLNFSSSEKVIEKKIEHIYSANDPEFSRSLGCLLGPSLLKGNKVTVLTNGVEIFPAMLKAIDQAEKSICFETYICWSGEIAQKFVKALSKKASDGVKVNVIVDWFGAIKFEKDLEDELVSAGVRFVRFHPPKWYNISRMNNRTHRKILILDGKVGFTGGVGIADVWLGNADKEDHWRETHFKIEGPAVTHLVSAFHDDWLKTVGEVLHGDFYFPDIPVAGEVVAHAFSSSALGGSESARLMVLLAITAATEEILISTAYFIPDRPIIDAFKRARKRGVSIKIILPGEIIDEKLVRVLSKKYWGELLESGVEIYEYQPTMYHCKIMMVDGVWCSVGSMNFDSRSFSLNEETNFNIHDKFITKKLKDSFINDQSHSIKVEYETWKNRGFKQKLLEKLILPLRTQL